MMTLSAQEVWSGYTTIAALLSTGRPMPLPAAGRFASMLAGLKPDFDAISASRNAIIATYEQPAPADGQQPDAGVPPDKMADFGARMASIGPLPLTIEPLKISELLMAYGGSVQLAVTLQELVMLGPLVEA